MATTKLARLTDTVCHAAPAKPGELGDDVKNFALDGVGGFIIKRGALAIAAGAPSAGIGTAAVTLVTLAELASAAGDVSTLSKWMARIAPGKIVGHCSPNVFVEGQPVAASGSIVQCPMPFLRFATLTPDGVQFIEDRRPCTVFVNNRPVAREGDKVSCFASIDSGAGSVFSG